MNGINGIIIIIFGFIILIGALTWMLVNVASKKTKEKNSDEEKLKRNPKTENAYKKNQNSAINKEDIFNFMNFDRIEDDMIIQDKGKKYNAVIKCKGINYNLMSEIEQLSVEEGFITFLNTLKSPIQLYVQAQNIDLKESILEYRNNMKTLEEEYEDLSTKYTVLMNSLETTDEEIQEVEIKRGSILNVLEYGNDIVRYVERLSLNKAMLQRSFYIVVSYYSSELTLGSEFKKEEIADMCYTELFTRVQNIMSGLLTCSVSSEILNSNALTELLYSAYNRDDENYINVRDALETGFHRLYSTSEDAITKKHKKLIEGIKEEAEYKAIEALARTIEEGNYLSAQAAESEYEQEVSRQAIDLVKKERVSNELKERAKKIIIEDYKINERRRIQEIKEDKEALLKTFRELSVEEGRNDKVEEVLEKNEKKNLTTNESKSENSGDEKIV